jgi:hypothetical protein
MLACQPKCLFQSAKELTSPGNGLWAVPVLFHCLNARTLIGDSERESF